jgi:acetyltransferase-like isoleucine patch superfamily enzyme
MNQRGPVELGEAHDIDPLAIVGEVTGRDIADRLLVVGAHAKVRAFSILYGGSRIGANLETGHHVVIREENSIGDHLSIWNNSVIDYGCVIGDRVRIHSNCYVAQHTVIEDDVFLAPGVAIANDRYPICTNCLEGPVIRRGAKLGVNVTVLPGVDIGADALVGSGAVVTRDVPPRAIIVGNPAHSIGSVDELSCPKDREDCPGAAGTSRRARAAESKL